MGFWEMAIVLVIALVILGPKNLPGFAKTVARGIGEFRGATEDFKKAVTHDVTVTARRELPPLAPESQPTSVQSELTPSESGATTTPSS